MRDSSRKSSKGGNFTVSPTPRLRHSNTHLSSLLVLYITKYFYTSKEVTWQQTVAMLPWARGSNEGVSNRCHATKSSRNMSSRRLVLQLCRLQTAAMLASHLARASCEQGLVRMLSPTAITYMLSPTASEQQLASMLVETSCEHHALASWLLRATPSNHPISTHICYYEQVRGQM